MDYVEDLWRSASRLGINVKSIPVEIAGCLGRMHRPSHSTTGLLSTQLILEVSCSWEVFFYQKSISGGGHILFLPMLANCVYVYLCVHINFYKTQICNMSWFSYSFLKFLFRIGLWLIYSVVFISYVQKKCVLCSFTLYILYI